MKIEMFEPREVTVEFEPSEVTVEFVVGEQGEQGPPTSIEIGDVETLPSGAEAYLRMRGTAPNLILDAGLVSGADGSGGGGDSQIYVHHMDDTEDFGEGWGGYLQFVRVGNIVTVWGYYWGAEGVATYMITDKIPMGYISATQAFTNAFLLNESQTAIADTTLVGVSGNSLLFALEENTSGLHYMSTMVYVTLDDPPESDVFEPYNRSMLSNTLSPFKNPGGDSTELS